MIGVNILIEEEKIDKAGDGESEKKIDQAIEKEIEDKLHIDIEYKGTGKETRECVGQKETQDIRQDDTQKYVGQDKRRGTKKKIK